MNKKLWEEYSLLVYYSMQFPPLHTIKSWGLIEVWLRSFLTSVLDGHEL